MSERHAICGAHVVKGDGGKVGVVVLQRVREVRERGRPLDTADGDSVLERRDGLRSRTLQVGDESSASEFHSK